MVLMIVIICIIIIMMRTIGTIPVMGLLVHIRSTIREVLGPGGGE